MPLLHSLETLEATSIIQDDQILDSEILVEEVEVALRLLKLGRSKGADGLSAEHLIYGGTAIVLWLKKIFNRIISLEEVPSCLKEGVIIPVYKGKGKDPMVTHSYRGITLSSVIAKAFEIVILNRMSPVLDRLGFPDINQTAFQKGSRAPMRYLAHKKFYFITSDKVKAHFSASMTLKRLLTQ